MVLHPRCRSSPCPSWLAEEREREGERGRGETGPAEPDWATGRGKGETTGWWRGEGAMGGARWVEEQRAQCGGKRRGDELHELKHTATEDAGRCDAGRSARCADWRFWHARRPRPALVHSGPHHCSPRIDPLSVRMWVCCPTCSTMLRAVGAASERKSGAARECGGRLKCRWAERLAFR